MAEALENTYVVKILRSCGYGETSSDVRSTHTMLPKKVLASPKTMGYDWLIGLLLGALHVILVTVVYHFVPDNYMDEIFHVRQTRRYCNGSLEWDPMITTPPALYVIAMPFCGGYERYINSLLFVFTFVGFCRFRRMFTKNSHESVYMTAVPTLLLPVLLHSSVLFYTDLLSICTVVWGFSTESTLGSAFFFTLSVLTRQTNIVWAGFYGAVRLFHSLYPKRPVYSFVGGVWRLLPFVVLACAFLAFVHVNGGIVLGDPSAHQPQLHLAQLCYMVAFAAAHAWPQSLPHLNELLQEVFTMKSVFLTGAIGLAIHLCSLDHPYLLADNRHVPFYLWRWWLSVPAKRLALVPIYVGAVLFMSRLSSHLSPMLRTLYVLCTTAVILPAHLIEPRYFIIPYAIWRLSAKTSQSVMLNVFELVTQLLAFSFIFYLFLFKPFEWANDPGVKQRFMW